MHSGQGRVSIRRKTAVNGWQCIVQLIVVRLQIGAVHNKPACCTVQLAGNVVECKDEHMRAQLLGRRRGITGCLRAQHSQLIGKERLHIGALTTSWVGRWRLRCATGRWCSTSCTAQAQSRRWSSCWRSGRSSLVTAVGCLTRLFRSGNLGAHEHCNARGTCRQSE